jgi:hypothetical protein
VAAARVAAGILPGHPGSTSFVPILCNFLSFVSFVAPTAFSLWWIAENYLMPGTRKERSEVAAH